jgi:hypothetical protein
MDRLDLPLCSTAQGYASAAIILVSLSTYLNGRSMLSTIKQQDGYVEVWNCLQGLLLDLYQQ